MSGETENAVSGWTVDTLHRHIIELLVLRDNLYKERYDTQEKAMNAALAAAKEAVAKAEVAAEKRFDAVNEFRGQLNDQALTFMPRSEGEIRINQNSEKIDSLANRLNQMEGHSSGTSERANISRIIALAGGTMLISIIGIVVAILIAL